MTPRNLKTALAAYMILAIAAGFIIGADIRIRIVLWALFAGLAIKSVAAYMLQSHVPRRQAPSDGPDSVTNRSEEDS